MARHRVGKSFLSDEEYGSHVSENWKIGIFCVAAIFVGIIVTVILKEYEIPKFIRFSVIIFSSIIIGGIFAKFSDLIRTLIAITITLGVVYFIGQLIWSAI